MPTKKLIHCIHGMIWQTCNACKDKSEQSILEELSLQKEEQKQE